VIVADAGDKRLLYSNFQLFPLSITLSTSRNRVWCAR